jgi:hypothetical protein
MARSIGLVRVRDICEGLRLTSSEDGVFLHFRLPGDRSCGWRLDAETGRLGEQIALEWAQKALESSEAKEVSVDG